MRMLIRFSFLACFMVFGLIAGFIGMYVEKRNPTNAVPLLRTAMAFALVALGFTVPIVILGPG
jgi:hypothetical protein